MPRRARRSEIGVYHVMLRGINKQLIFQNEDDNYFINVLRYIHQNSVKAGIVKTSEEYN